MFPLFQQLPVWSKESLYLYFKISTWAPSSLWTFILVHRCLSVNLTTLKIHTLTFWSTDQCSVASCSDKHTPTILSTQDYRLWSQRSSGWQPARLWSVFLLHLWQASFIGKWLWVCETVLQLTALLFHEWFSILVLHCTAYLPSLAWPDLPTPDELIRCVQSVNLWEAPILQNTHLI